jgi:hypothetical protein
VQLAGAADGDVPGKDGEVQGRELGDIAHAPVDDQSGQAALLGGHCEHLTPVAVASALKIGDEQAARRRRVDRAVQCKVVAAHALNDERRAGDARAAVDGAQFGRCGQCDRRARPRTASRRCARVRRRS